MIVKKVHVFCTVPKSVWRP